MPRAGFRSRFSKAAAPVAPSNSLGSQEMPGGHCVTFGAIDLRQSYSLLKVVFKSHGHRNPKTEMQNDL